MYGPTILEDIPSATSLPESGHGATPCALQTGPITVPSGQDRALANHSAGLASLLGLLTSGTYGLTGTTSSESVALASSLVSRLQVRTASLGSTLYKLTWKERVTPMQRSIYALRASVRPISDNAYGSWPTPGASDPSGGGQFEGGLESIQGNTAALGQPDSVATAGCSPVSRLAHAIIERRESQRLLHQQRTQDIEARRGCETVGLADAPSLRQQGVSGSREDGVTEYCEVGSMADSGDTRLQGRIRGGAE